MHCECVNEVESLRAHHHDPTTGMATHDHAEVEGLREALDFVVHDFEVEKAEVDRLRAEAVTAKMEHTKVAEQVRQYKDENERLRKDYAYVEHRLNERMIALEDAGVEAERLREENRSLLAAEEDAGFLREEKDEVQRSFDSLRKDFERVQAEVQRLQAQRESDVIQQRLDGEYIERLRAQIKTLEDNLLSAEDILHENERLRVKNAMLAPARFEEEA